MDLSMRESKFTEEQISMALSSPARKRIVEIRDLLKTVGGTWNAGTPLARQATALDLARDHLPWLLEQFEAALDEIDDLQAQLDNCQELRMAGL